jgi:hypothetical protein
LGAGVTLPRVLDEWSTLLDVANRRLSLARWGDGEAKVATRRAAKTQPADHGLAKQLRRMLLSPDPRVMVAIPRIWPDEPPLATPGFWPQHRWVFEKYCKPGHVWGSAFVSRRDAWPIPDEPAYWRLFRSIWWHRPVLLVTGTKKGRRAQAGGLLDTAASVDVLDCLNQGAWSAYDGLMADMVAWAAPKADPVVVLACGATATVAAYDLQTKHGVQAIDAGHAAQAMARMDPREDEAA